jgi:hypothetical protein
MTVAVKCNTAKIENGRRTRSYVAADPEVAVRLAEWPETKKIVGGSKAHNLEML